MSEQTVTINHLPAPTWNWLHLNNANVRIPDAKLTYIAADEVPSGIVKEVLDAATLNELPSGFAAGAQAVFDEIGEVVSYTATENISNPIRLDYDFSEGANSINAIELHAAEGSSMLVIQNFHSEKNGFGFAGVSTKYEIEKNATITLVQIQTLGDQLTFCNDIGGRCDEDGHFKLIQLVLGGKETYIGSHTALSGKHADLEIRIAYRVEVDHLLDMNYVADHTGKKTHCDIQANGVLRDQAKKLFRGTIDFKRGCAGATGSELEDVLLMDDGVINQTIPLILCSEEDVEGTHGATIGKLNEELLFYLESRGLALGDIYEMMARARIDAVCNLIPDEKTKEFVTEYLGKEREDEES